AFLLVRGPSKPAGCSLSLCQHTRRPGLHKLGFDRALISASSHNHSRRSRAENPVGGAVVCKWPSARHVGGWATKSHHCSHKIVTASLIDKREAPGTWHQLLADPVRNFARCVFVANQCKRTFLQCPARAPLARLRCERTALLTC